MRVMVLVKATEDSEKGDYAGHEAEFAAMGRYNEELLKAGIMLAGEGLTPLLVENSATTAGLGFHADCRYSLISPASLARRSTRAAGTGKAMTSGVSSGARRPMPSPWWLRPVL
jgi:hypothetical protein